MAAASCETSSGWLTSLKVLWSSSSGAYPSMRQNASLTRRKRKSKPTSAAPTGAWSKVSWKSRALSASAASARRTSVMSLTTAKAQVTVPSSSGTADGVTSTGKRSPDLRMKVRGNVSDPPASVAAMAARMEPSSSGGQYRWGGPVPMSSSRVKPVMRQRAGLTRR